MFLQPPSGLNGIRAVLLDLSGVLYVGDRAIPGVAEALRRLQTAGYPLRYVTNTTRHSRARIVRELSSIGFTIPPEHLATAPAAIHTRLQAEGRRPLLLLNPDLAPEFEDMATDDPDVVVLGDMGEAFDYAHLNRAFRTLMQGAPLWVMGVNRYFREADGLSLDLGPFVRALEFAADVTAENFGKPDPRLFHAAVADLDLSPEEVLVVGDDVTSDVEGALDAGMAACLVQTGKYQPGDENLCGHPGAGLAGDLADVVDGLLDPACHPERERP
ncbi:TIGR01458 family HAD-type hydrolase [Thioalkalivibrio sp. AKL17]|uniref:TIGR01458 family HAD-type hydrolase n=1 Tax=Thioalkalivibrio sp. AKL17 TaxID=1158160 RepID=UPI00037AB8F1|nr:TIGR01458 family HAD-type hydrolase [Thioalkalivibrio sp. AKL17]